MWQALASDAEIPERKKRKIASWNGILSADQLSN
jgi:hypothetical protein